jgi:hypothetical protein
LFVNFVCQLVVANMTPEKQGQKQGRERRRSMRVWVRSPGKVTVLRGLRGSATIACTILNRSKGGALIKVPDASAVPDDFYLAYDEDPNRKMVCAVVRRSRQLLAVRYISQPSTEVRVVRLSS